MKASVMSFDGLASGEFVSIVKEINSMPVDSGTSHWNCAVCDSMDDRGGKDRTPMAP